MKTLATIQLEARASGLLKTSGVPLAQVIAQLAALSSPTEPDFVTAEDGTPVLDEAGNLIVSET